MNAMTDQAISPCLWPDPVGPHVIRSAVNNHMIRFFDESRPEVMSAFQKRHFAGVVSHAARVSPWWRNWLGIADAQRSVRFKDIPLLSREMFRASLADAAGPLPIPPDHGRCESNSTSGSTGVPITFHVSARAGNVNSAHYGYDRVRQGVRADGLIARITPRIIDEDNPTRIVEGSPLLGYGREVWRMMRTFTLEEQARWLSALQPSYVIAHTSVLHGIMDAYESGEVPPPPQGLTAVISIAETVTPTFREQTRRVTGARILDRYSCEEAGPLAFQCPSSDEHLHIAGTNVLVEVLDEAGRPSPPGEIGRVYVTALHNLANPVIRYELGDLAAWAPRCVCGYDKPVLSQLLGRTRFLIRLPSGGRRAVRISAKHWMNAGPITEARIVQVSHALIRAEYVAERVLTEAEREVMFGILRREITPELRYELVQTDRIAWGPTYKRQDVVSLV